MAIEFLPDRENTLPPADARIEAHPLAEIFPLLDPGDLKALAEDIRANGQHDPIVIHEGMILDGRNRYAACRMAGVAAQFTLFPGKDPLAFVIGRNMHRRHLTPSQRAMAAAKIETLTHGGNRPGAGRGGGPAENQDANVHLEKPVTRAAAAAALQVSPRLAASAAVVRAAGSDRLRGEVESGRVTVRAAETLARRLPKDEQDAALDGGAENVRRMAASMRQAARAVTPEQTEIWRAEDALIALARRNGGALTVDAAAMRAAAGYRLILRAHPSAKGVVIVRAEARE